MKSSKKAVLSAGIATLLVLGTVGCDSGTGKSNSSSSSGEISMFASPGVGVNLKTNAFTKYIEKKFNMQINWVQAPSSDASTKQSLLLSSGDYPDVFWSGSFSHQDILKYSQEGILVPLNSLIKKYAPNVWKGIQTVPGLKEDVTAPDGNIYGLPGVNYCFHCDWSNKMWINTTLLKKYGLQMPTTTQQFTHVLQVFKQHGLIPLSGDTDGWNSEPFTYLMNAFIYDDGNTFTQGAQSDYFDIENGKVTFAPIQPQWKQGLEYVHTLYTEGLLDKQALSQQSTVLQREVAQGKVGVIPGGTPGVVNYTPTSNNYKVWQTVPPLKGPDGVQYAAFYGMGSSGATFTITNKATKSQEIQLMKLLNFMWTPIGTETFDYGPPGQLWTLAKKGQLGMTGKQALFKTDWGKLIGPQNEGYSQMGPMFQNEAWRNGDVAAPPFSYNGVNQSLLQLETEQFYAGHQPQYVYPSGIAWIPSNEAEQYSLYQTNIDSFVEQWMSEFIIGSKSINQDWNTYVKGVENLSLKQYLQMAQTAMKQPFDTSSFKSDPADVKFLLSLKSGKN
ncbi:extracellular solute-binding protein [Alicyclobacillus fodiniaquatilis]|uniref:Extracellular solute-binding protein n=1 Tax=Alicyclobacillus fodiniaquatilis TaxID=1661150 RepID=A0ABW4JDD6_9BACL